MTLTRTQPKKIYIPIQKTAIYTPTSYTSLYMPLDGTYTNLGNDTVSITSQNDTFYDNVTFKAAYSNSWSWPAVVAWTLATPIDTHSCTISLRAYQVWSQPSGEWGWCNYFGLTDWQSTWHGIVSSKVGTNSYYGSNVNKIAVSKANSSDAFSSITAVQMTWYHLCAVWDSWNLHLYINGHPEITTNISSYSCSTFWVGESRTWWNSEFIIESRPWTAAEVRDYYNDNASRFIFN